MSIGIYGAGVLYRLIKQSTDIKKLKENCLTTYCTGMSDEEFHQRLHNFIDEFNSIDELKSQLANDIAKYGGEQYLADLEEHYETARFIDGHDW